MRILPRRAGYTQVRCALLPVLNRGGQASAVSRAAAVSVFLSGSAGRSEPGVAGDRPPTDSACLSACDSVATLIGFPCRRLNAGPLGGKGTSSTTGNQQMVVSIITGIVTGLISGIVASFLFWYSLTHWLVPKLKLLPRLSKLPSQTIRKRILLSI